MDNKLKEKIERLENDLFRSKKLLEEERQENLKLRKLNKGLLDEHKKFLDIIFKE